MRVFKFKSGLYHIALAAHGTLCGLSVAKAQREVHFKSFDEFPREHICYKCGESFKEKQSKQHTQPGADHERD